MAGRDQVLGIRIGLSSHAIAEVVKLAPRLGRDATLLVNLSGRGDKDLETVLAALEARGSALR